MPLFDSGKGDVQYGSLPNTTATQFGSSYTSMLDEGTLYRYVSTTGTSPGATGGDYVLATYTLPALALDVAGRGLSIEAQGSFAANTNNKTLKIFWGCTTAVVGSAVTGGTAIANTGVVATNGNGWALAANVFKTGNLGSNTQLGLHQASQEGAAVSALTAPTALTATESLPIIIAVTGNAATTATDIVLNFMLITGMN